MSAQKRPLRGEHHPVGEGDLRTPCPMLNSLANHGYLPRNGRDIKLEDFFSALTEVNIAGTLQTAMAQPLYSEHYDDEHPAPKQSFLAGIWKAVTNPLSVVFSKFGVRPPGLVDAQGHPVINLDHVSLHNAIEHDVSLSRRDFGQGDNHAPQKDLIEGLLAASSDGEYLTMDDLVKYRKHRIETQQRENKKLDFTPLAHELGAGEIALILKVLGDGQKAKKSYVKAFFSDERLPFEEGWKKRDSPLGVIELVGHTRKVKGLLGATS